MPGAVQNGTGGMPGAVQNGSGSRLLDIRRTLDYNLLMIVRLIIKELLHRKFNFLMGLLAITAAAALFVSFHTMSTASDRETKQITRSMGFNLRIIPADTDMNQFWISSFSNLTMPENYVKKFADYGHFSYAHLTATLQQKITWKENDVVLAGIAQEFEPSGIKKSPMIFSITPGTAYIGFEAAKREEIKKGDKIEIEGKTLTVMKILSESGSIDDITIYIHLSDAQDILGMEGQINEIKALNCLCLNQDSTDPVDLLRKQLSQVLPDAKVIMNKVISSARKDQRQMVENFFSYLLPIVLVAAAAWICILALLNVKERKHEIGILRSLGYGSSQIAALFLVRAVILGILGAALGFAVGTQLSLAFGPAIFKITAGSIKPINSLLILLLVTAPVFTAVSTLIPTAMAVTQDPARTLVEE